MTPDELIAAACPKISALGSAFYFAPETLAAGKEAGLDGFRLYFLGRGGVLGDVEASVIVSAFGYFTAGVVEGIWTSAKQVMAPRDAARLYGRCAADHGARKLGGVEGLEAFNAAADKIITAAHPAAMALFAGWAAEPRTDDPAGRAMQSIAVLRELRGGAHLAAVVAVGLQPGVAHAIKRPDMVKAFGYDEVPEATDADRDRLAEAERITDALVLPAYSVLDAAEADAFVATLEQIEAALKV
ncbi:MAG TPA: hypothetical protein VF855_12605 [Acidimicrobiales bacterium]